MIKSTESVYTDGGFSSHDQDVGLGIQAPLNNLSPDRAESIIDNTAVPPINNNNDENTDTGYGSRTLSGEATISESGRHKRENWLRRQNTKKKLQEVKKMIEKNVNESQTNNRLSDMSDKPLNITAERDSGTLPKTTRPDSHPPSDDPYDNHTNSGKRDTKVIRECVQQGDNNFTIFLEEKEQKSFSVKQFGNNNVFINININSNALQVLDKFGDIVPHMSEVWLEIKRRTEQSKDTNDNINMNNGSCSSSTDRLRRSAQEHGESAGSTNDSESVFSYSQDRSRSPDEQSDYTTPYLVENLYEEPIYDTVTYLDRDTISLKLKAPSGSKSWCLEESSFLDDILKYQGLNEFIQGQEKGTNLDFTVNEWEYDTESNYDYIAIGSTETEQSGYATVNEFTKTKRISPHTPLSQISAPVNCKSADNVINNNEQSSEPRYRAYPPKLPPKPPSLGSSSDPMFNNSTDGYETPVTLFPKSTALPPKLGPKPTTTRQVPKATEPITSRQVSKAIGTPTSPVLPLPPPHKSTKTIKHPLDTKSQATGIQGRVWYHGAINSDEAKRRLKDMPHGSFLVRDSSQKSSSHMYTIVFTDEGNIKRLQILQSNGKFYFTDSKEKTFAMVEDLIEELIKTSLEITGKNGSWKHIKVKPVPRPS